jgi:type II secretory pathway pseudopilin PulG
MANRIELQTRCSQCQTIASRDARFCHKCGAGINGSEVVALRRPALVTFLACLNSLAFLSCVFSLIRFAWAPGAPSDVPTRGLVLALGGYTFLAGVGAWGLWLLRPYGRAIQLGLAWLGLLAVPIGTFFSILLLVYFYKPGARLLFSGRDAGHLTQAETQEIVRSGQGRGVLAVFASALVFFVVVVAGLVAGVALPNLQDAIQRARQKRTVRDIERVSLAVNSYATDHGGRYPEAASIEDLARMLAKIDPDMPKKDGWGNSLRYRRTPSAFWVASAGRDGKWQKDDPSYYTERATSSFDDDIVCKNGVFVQAPRGSAGASSLQPPAR